MPLESLQVSPDEVSLDETQEAETEVKEEAKESDSEFVLEVESESKPEDKKEEKDSELAKENAKLRTQLLEIGQEVRQLKGSVEERSRREGKAPEEASDKISHEQLVGLIKEHGDNPEVMARIITHIATEEAKSIATGIRDETVKNVEYQNWFRELKAHSTGVMQPIYESAPESRGAVVETAKRLGIDGHPMGELLAYSLIEYARRQGSVAKEAADADRATKLDKEKGLDKTRTAGDKGSKGKIALSKEQREIADKLGVSHATYAKFIPKEGE